MNKLKLREIGGRFHQDKALVDLVVAVSGEDGILGYDINAFSAWGFGNITRWGSFVDRAATWVETVIGSDPMATIAHEVDDCRDAIYRRQQEHRAHRRRL